MMHGWYSRMAAELYGSFTCNNEDGKPVEATVLLRSFGAEYRWPDKVYVGLLTEETHKPLCLGYHAKREP